MKVTIHEEMEKKVLTLADVKPGELVRVPSGNRYRRTRQGYVCENTWNQYGDDDLMLNGRIEVERVLLPDPPAHLTFADVELGQGARLCPGGLLCVKTGNMAYLVCQSLVNHTVPPDYHVESVYDLELIARRVK